MKKERVDARVETELLEELDIIAQRENLGSRSAAIREAIASYVMEHKEGWNSTGIRVNIPNRLAYRLQLRIMNEDAMDLDEAVRMAITDWVKGLEQFYLRDRYVLEKITAENIEGDSALREMRRNARMMTRE